MATKEVIKKVIQENAEFIGKIKLIVKRDFVHYPREINKVVVFYGVRRSGKTYCLYDIFLQNPGRCLYLDFEDERLENFKAKDFELMIEAFLELNPQLAGQEFILLLDEIQNVPGWEKFARRAAEKERLQVFVSGSSSKMMPQELHTVLRGRSWGLESNPFSFKEYLHLKRINYSEPSYIYGKHRHLINQRFQEYLIWGGFPEVCFLADEIDKAKVVREYLEAIFFKDLVEKHKISNLPLIEALRDKLFSSFGLKLSLTAFYKQHKNDFPFSKDSLFAYYHHFLDSLICFESKIFSPSSYKRTRNPAKIYLVDVGLAKRQTSADKGRRLENLIFLALKQKGGLISYFEEQYECDLIAKDARGNLLPLQVTWELSPENKEREIAGLVEACRRLGSAKGIMITRDGGESEKRNGINIEFAAAPLWLLS